MINRLFATACVAVFALTIVLSPPINADLAGDLKAILSDPQLKGGIDGVVIADAHTGKRVYSRTQTR